MITQIISFFEEYVPELMIAAAAVAVFIMLGLGIFISILFESWYAAWRGAKQKLHAKLAAEPAPRREPAAPLATTGHRAWSH